MQKEEKEIYLGLFLELAEDNKITYNQIPVNTLIENMEGMKIGFFKNAYFFLGDEGEIKTIGFFRDSSELAKIMDKKHDKCDDHPCIYIMQAKFIDILENLNE